MPGTTPKTSRHHRLPKPASVVTVHDGKPAVNVKAYQWGPRLAEIEAEYKVTAEDAQAMLGRAWDDAVRMFWKRDWQGEAQHIFKTPLGQVKVYSGGRSGGWMEVHGLPDVEEWTGRGGLTLRRQWAKFEALVKAELEQATSDEYPWALLDELQPQRFTVLTLRLDNRDVAETVLRYAQDLCKETDRSIQWNLTDDTVYGEID